MHKHAICIYVAMALWFGLQPAQAQDVAAGPDPFTSVTPTEFNFAGFPIPAGFFDTGSSPFRGRISFRGVPIRTYTDKRGVVHKDADAATVDTVVERLQNAALPASFPSRATVDVEMTALSLQSVAPIPVRVGAQVQRWNVTVVLSIARPSSGRMVITRNNAAGGTFRSQLTVYPRFTFTRVSDSVVRVLDLGELAASEKLRPGSPALGPLVAFGVPWQSTSPQPDELGGTVQGWGTDFYATDCRKLPTTERAALARHGVCRSKRS